MTVLLPEVSAEGLVLWRVRQPPARNLCCCITESGGELMLGVHDIVTDDVLFAEVHRDVVSLVSRAEELQDDYLAAGWHACDLAEADTVI